MDKLSCKDLTAKVIMGVGPGAVLDSSSAGVFNQSCFFFFWGGVYLIEASKILCWGLNKIGGRCMGITGCGPSGCVREGVRGDHPSRP